MSALTDYFTSLANKIRSKTGKNSTLTPVDMVSEIDAVYDAGAASIPTPTAQTKSVTPSTSAQTVTPDSGYDYLNQVNVGAIQIQTKSATPSTTAQTITPDSGKFLSSVSVDAIQTQTKSATPTTSAQTISPDSGKYLSSVSVGAIQTQEKTADAYSSYSNVKTITPDSGKYLSKVNIPMFLNGSVLSDFVPKSFSSTTNTLTFSNTGLYILIIPNEFAITPSISGLIKQDFRVADSMDEAVAHIYLLSIGNTSRYVRVSCYEGTQYILVKLADT